MRMLPVLVLALAGSAAAASVPTEWTFELQARSSLNPAIPSFNLPDFSSLSSQYVTLDADGTVAIRAFVSQPGVSEGIFVGKGGQGGLVLTADSEVDPHELHRRTGGNPFYVTEILASGEPGVPISVSDAVLARAARLPAHGRAVLDVAAVLGFRFDPDLVVVLSSVRDVYDHVLIDCPPAFGLLTLNALCAADEVLIPVQPEFFALEGLSQFVEGLEAVRGHLNPRLEVAGILLTLFDGRLALAREVADEVRQHFGARTLQTIIPRNVRLAEAPGFGRPALLYDIGSAGAQAYLSLASEIAARQHASTVPPAAAGSPPSPLHTPL